MYIKRVEEQAKQITEKEYRIQNPEYRRKQETTDIVEQNLSVSPSALAVTSIFSEYFRTGNMEKFFEDYDRCEKCWVTTRSIRCFRKKIEFLPLGEYIQHLFLKLRTIMKDKNEIFIKAVKDGCVSMFSPCNFYQ